MKIKWGVPINCSEKSAFHFSRVYKVLIQIFDLNNYQRGISGFWSIIAELINPALKVLWNSHAEFTSLFLKRQSKLYQFLAADLLHSAARK